MYIPGKDFCIIQVWLFEGGLSPARFLALSLKT